MRRHLAYLTAAAIVIGVWINAGAGHGTNVSTCYDIRQVDCWLYLAQVIPCNASCPTCCAIPVANNPVTDKAVSPGSTKDNFTVHVVNGQCCYWVATGCCSYDYITWGCLNCFFDQLTGNPC